MARTLTLRLLGGFAARAPSGIIDIRSRRTRALLAYLAMHADRAIKREFLASLLWDQKYDRDIRQNLRQSLLDLRRSLAETPEVLTVRPDVVTLHGKACEIDVHVVARACDARDWQQAASLFHGPFLDGLTVDSEVFGDWVRVERNRSDALFTQILETAALQAHREHRGERAIALAERLVDIEPLREESQRLLVLIYAHYRGRLAALGQLDTLTRLLKRELDLQPEPATLALGAQIRNGNIVPMSYIETPSMVA